MSVTVETHFGEERKVSRVIRSGGRSWYLAYMDNCFDPPLILVQGDTIEEAEDTVLEHPLVVRDCKVEPDDPDYAEEISAFERGEGRLRWNGSEILDPEALVIYKIMGDRINWFAKEVA